MAAKRRTANQYRRTRRDHSTETAEDYVEAIDDTISELGRCRVVDLADRFGVSHVTVTKIIKRLQRDGFVETEPYGPITLSHRGKRLADASRQRHETVYRFLLAIGVSQRTAAVDSEGIEHHVSAETLEKLKIVTERLS